MQHDNKITRNVADTALKILMGEEPDNQQFTQEVEKAKTKASEKKSPEDEARVAKASVQAVQNEELKGGQKNILIDDYEKNVSEFIRAGGMGIVHKDYRNTIRSLKLLGIQ